MSEPRRKRSKEELESADGNKRDCTAALPDELLCQVLGYLSLRDKFQSEAVNNKFRRCVLDLLKHKPQSLTISSAATGERLNGYYVPMEQFAEAVRHLAGKASFSDITIRCTPRSKTDERLNVDSILSAFSTSDFPCLSCLKTLRLETKCTGAALEQFLAKCGKLSTVRLRFSVRPLSSAQYPSSVAIDLASALKDKELTHFRIPHLAKFSHHQLLNLFDSLKPNTLLKVELSPMPMPDMAALVRDLGGSAWGALQQMTLISKRRVDIENLFAALGQLPKFEKCELVLYRQSILQFVPDTLSALDSGIQFAVHCSLSFDHGIRGCEIMSRIGRIQNYHPSLQVDFVGQRLKTLVLTQGNVTFESRMHTISGCGGDCVQCHSFYPLVTSAVATAARGRKNVNLEGYQLNQCRINRIVDHINVGWALGEGWALGVERNHVHETAAIIFNGGFGKQYSVSVRYGPCLSSSCIQCVNVD